MSITDVQFWIALLQIIGIDILLSGDNAVVIALAARNLPPRERKLAVVLGTGGAVVMRIVFATIIVYLLQIPYLKLVGAVLLFWIAIKLLVPEEGGTEGKEGKIKAGPTLLAAMGTIMLADAVMSLDNVIGIAAAAKGSVLLLVIGLAISIPLVVYGSTLMLKLLDRYPWLVMLGSGLLGWVAGEIAVGDPFSAKWIATILPNLSPAVVHYGAAVIGAVFVLVVGYPIAQRKKARIMKASA